MLGYVEVVLKNSIFQLAVACVLVVVGWKQGVTGEHRLLVFAWVLASIALARMPFIAAFDAIPRVLLTGLIASIIGLGLYFTLWTRGRPSATEKTIIDSEQHLAPHERSSQSMAPNTQSPAATTVQLYLEYWPSELPKTIPPNGQVFAAFAMQEKDTIAFDLIPIPSDPQGKIITWNDRTDPRSMFGGVCRLTNYAGAVLFDVDLLISTEFHEAVRLKPDAFGPGKVTAQHDWTIRVPKIEASRQEPFVFYIVNEAQAYVTITIRDATSATVAGQSDRRKVQLVRMTGGMTDEGLSLTPKDFAKLP